jgi:hypothetical protein
MSVTLSYLCSSFSYTVTRPSEVFRHPDWMAPESTVRGRENDSLVRPGYINLQIPSCPVITDPEIYSVKKYRVTQCRIDITSFRLLILFYTPTPQLPGIMNHKYKTLSPPLTFPAWRIVKYQHGRGTYCTSPMLLFYIPPCRKTFPAWRNVIYQYGQGTKCSGTTRVFSHYQNCNFPEESFILSTFCNSVYSFIPQSCLIVRALNYLSFINPLCTYVSPFSQLPQNIILKIVVVFIISLFIDTKQKHIY